MKSIISFIVTSSFILFFASCEEPEVQKEISEQEVQVEKLVNEGKAWSTENGQVTVDDRDLTDFFAGFVIKFDETSLRTEQSPNEKLWPSSATWIFENESTDKIVRSDGVVMNLEFLSETSLKISFVYDEKSINSRTMGLSGKYEFVLDSE